MAKTITFAILHMTVAFSVAYLLSGSLLVGGAIALVEPAINTVVYFFHEQVWEHIRQKRADGVPGSLLPA
ncbi:DUF2061 domain-containing protein [Thiocapsa bogorovii]|uniref:DUF2061 domain-containing protein n=1 Tax=Thiocapsa bogorovii TaxID=521689 RepID=UPI001E4A9033|nr:DUF2061 domain-containing protein [Thiocapsa bogorovii]UHD17713.1 DUF2061 domain-containing protein [Thiocapsa bogorovii]